MKPYVFVSIVLLMSWGMDMTNGFCDKFPFGHICRNMDLTGFCLQVSHFLKIRQLESRIAPYQNLEKIFQRLKTKAKADKPFVHFGGYKKNNVYTCPEDYKKCAELPTPAPATIGPPPPGTPLWCWYPTAVPPPPPPPACPMGTHIAGPPPMTDTTDPTYVGCDKDCECCQVPPDDTKAFGTIFSLQDGCELKYLKAPLQTETGQDIYPIAPLTDAKENPYRLNITEITVKGVPLHNWLHITIGSTGDIGLGQDAGDLGSGKIKMAFIMANDAMGFPIGEFVNTIPCGNCNCSESKDPAKQGCHQGNFDDTFPCMYDGKRVTTNTGMMMVYSKFDSPGEGLAQIHATWRMTQSNSPEAFATEIHFVALIVDEFRNFKMPATDTKNFRLSAISERRTVKEGMFGWNPVYMILHPTVETVGAYDYFREDIFVPEDINCHVPIDPRRYTAEPYPDSGKELRPVLETPEGEEHCYRLNDTIGDEPDPDPNAPSPPPPQDISSFCSDPPNSKTMERHPIMCPGLRSKVKPWFIDTFGFIKRDQVDGDQIYPWTMFGARTEAYVLRDGGLEEKDWTKYNSDAPREGDLRVYFGTEKNKNELAYAECGGGSADNYYGMAHRHQYPGQSEAYTIDKAKYGHFCGSNGFGRRVLNFPNVSIDKWPNTLGELWKFPPVNSESFLDDRCYCPRIPPTPDPRYREPPEVQVQGRRQHAYQMIIAWNCIVPFGIFVSRYFKETYSKVFFLQEYWWYTIHVLCMISAAMFTFGGLYVMELKRRDPINWLDPNVTIHVIIGYTVITVFFFQCVSGFFRLKDAKKRIFQIFTHWLFGVIEYLLAIVCMINAAFILLSGMSCEGVVALGFLLVSQIMFYASMEVHMRNVDKLLKLNPPRSYLPPPIMRVFHKDAPDSKFRVHVLIAYFALCVITSLIQYVSMESNKLGESCFVKSKKYITITDGIYED